jgi:hypothetical protein
MRNHDRNDGSNPPDAGKSEPTVNNMAVQVARDKATEEEERRVEEFGIQSKTFQNQVRAQKGKIVDLQNRARSLSDQFDAWSVCVMKTRNRHAVRKMKVGPSEPPCRRRLQTAISCFGSKDRGGERYG